MAPNLKFYKHNHLVGMFVALTKNKGAEFNFHYRPHLYFVLSLAIVTKGDHSPTFVLDFQLFGIGIEIDMYDFHHEEHKDDNREN